MQDNRKGNRLVTLVVSMLLMLLSTVCFYALSWISVPAGASWTIVLPVLVGITCIAWLALWSLRFVSWLSVAWLWIFIGGLLAMVLLGFVFQQVTGGYVTFAGGFPTVVMALSYPVISFFVDKRELMLD